MRNQKIRKWQSAPILINWWSFSNREKRLVDGVKIDQLITGGVPPTPWNSSLYLPRWNISCRVVNYLSWEGAPACTYTLMKGYVSPTQPEKHKLWWTIDSSISHLFLLHFNGDNGPTTRFAMYQKLVMNRAVFQIARKIQLEWLALWRNGTKVAICNSIYPLVN